MSNNIRYRKIDVKEAISLISIGKVVECSFADGWWHPLKKDTELSMNLLAKADFREVVSPIRLEFTATSRPTNSKRRCFHYHNRETDISVYVKGNYIPTANAINVIITEIVD